MSMHSCLQGVGSCHEVSDQKQPWLDCQACIIWEMIFRLCEFYSFN